MDLERRVKLLEKGKVLLLRWPVAVLVAQKEVAEEELVEPDHLRLDQVDELSILD